MTRKNLPKARKTPLQERSRTTVETILEAAAQVFVTRGYAGGSTNHIARRAGVSIGSVYQYFPNKESIALRLVERHLQEGERMLSGLFEKTGGQTSGLRELLTLFIGTMVELHSADPKLQHVLLDEIPHPHEVREGIRRLKDKVISGITALLANQAEVKVNNLHTAAYMIVNTVESLTHEFAAAPPARLSRKRFVGELVYMLECYLTRGPRSSTRTG